MLYQLSYFRICFANSAFSAALDIIKCYLLLLSLAREFRFYLS